MTSRELITSTLMTVAIALAPIPLLNAGRIQANDVQNAVQTIDGHGSVTAFPDAKAQPRDGSRIVIDLTTGGPRESTNPGVEKLARFVNIYAAAGESPARVRIVVVLHGDATEVALSDDSYATTFKTNFNPNLSLVRKLRRAGVQLLVCGQSLTKKGHTPDQLSAEVELAVSALTALANHQQDGFAYVPLK